MDSLTPSFSTQWPAKGTMVQTKKKTTKQEQNLVKKQKQKTGATSYSISIMFHMSDRKIF